MANARAQVPSGTSTASEAGTRLGRTVAIVETANEWGSGWTRPPYVVPLQAIVCCAPEVGRATFKFNYGRIKREDKTAFAEEAASSLYGAKYIRIRRAGAAGSSVLWVGSIEAESLSPWAGNAGEQVFEAFSLGHDLDSVAIDSAKAQVGGGAVIDLDWVPVFNERFARGVALFGNRSAGVPNDGDGEYVFSDEEGEWTNRDIAEMLLKRHVPANGPTYKLAGELDALASIVERHDLQGVTTWRALNQLIRRQRGLGFYLEPGPGNVVQVVVFSVLDTPVKVGEIEVPANAKAFNLNLDNSLLVANPVIVRSKSTKYDKVRALGARILVAFTSAHDDNGTGEGHIGDWTEELQQEYLDAGLGVAEGYDALTDAEKADLNDAYRVSDRFEAMYTRFKLDPTWTGKIAGDVAIPTIKENGEIEWSQPGPFWNYGKYFEPFLPFQAGVDYSQSPPDESNLPADAEPMYLRPFCLVAVRDGSGEVTGYRYVNDPGEEYKEYSADFFGYPRGLAFGVRGSPPHIWAKNWFQSDSEAEDYNAQPTNASNLPQFDFVDLYPTLAVRLDQRAKAEAALEGLDEDEARIRVKTLYAADCELWLCAPNTFVGVDADGAEIICKDTILRDDRERLRQTAAFGLAWYGVERRSVSVTLRTLVDPVPLGSMLKAVATAGVSKDVRTVVTSKSWNFGVAPHTTTIQTMWAETDWE